MARIAAYHSSNPDDPDQPRFYRNALLAFLAIAVVQALVACTSPASTPTPTPTATLVPPPTPTATPTPLPTATPTPTPTLTLQDQLLQELVDLRAAALTPTPLPIPTPASTGSLTVTEVLDLATAALENDLSGRIESEFRAGFGEYGFLSETTSGVWETFGPASSSFDPYLSSRAHFTSLFVREIPHTIEVDGQTIGLPDLNIEQESILDKEYVYVMSSPPYGKMRAERRWEDPDLLRFLDYYHWLVASESSVAEQELNGERVYKVTGPTQYSGAYPVLGTSRLNGVVQYWIGAEDYLLRRFEISDVVPGDGSKFSGFIALSDFGVPVDIQVPVHEGGDDHSNSPTDATEIAVGEPVTGTLDSWLDFDYFRFQAEEGKRYKIVVSVESVLNQYGGLTVATLYEPDGVTENWDVSSSSMRQDGARIEWEAPASDTYYLRVERGKDGMVPYTLTITPVE